MEPKNFGACALAALAVLCMIGAGCTGFGQDKPATPGIPTPAPGESAPAAVQAVADANNRFACELYAQLAADPRYAGGNLFFSPFSISSALAITYEGARGETAGEIRSVMHFPDDTATLREGFLDINAGLTGDAGYTLHTANALWAEKTHPFLPAYLATAKSWYGANTTNLDFITAPDESRRIINRWVEEQTEDKITDLIPPDAIDRATRLVITNAVYFKGDWVLQFDRNNTREADFRTASGAIVQVPMMERTDEEAVYGYAETDDLQLLSMPYEQGSGKKLSMVVLLPKSDGLSVIEGALDAEQLAGLQASATPRRVLAWLPKFTLETKYFLPETLSDMGMPGAFTAAADFSGMDGTRELFITDVIHQAFIDVNEEGTEAAAATAVIMGKAAMPEPVPEFRADHPFVFVIQDDDTGAILFMGRVAAPA
ncbi:MAG: serpin family protein [Methanomicrobiales archaeon]|nr:serpin family protein [Methanomicrobiales archaeon]